MSTEYIVSAVAILIFVIFMVAQEIENSKLRRRLEKKEEEYEHLLICHRIAIEALSTIPCCVAIKEVADESGVRYYCAFCPTEIPEGDHVCARCRKETE